MSFQWADFLELSKFLQQQAANGFLPEASYRCAVSRAYYAAFCHAREFAGDAQRPDRYVPVFKPAYDHADHYKLREHFKKHSRSFGNPHLHFHLDRLHKLRKQCDYDNQVDNLPELTDAALVISQKIIAQLA